MEKFDSVVSEFLNESNVQDDYYEKMKQDMREKELAYQEHEEKMKEEIRKAKQEVIDLKKKYAVQLADYEKLKSWIEDDGK